jgi:lipopolysaccharide transport system ATP-binding protein
MSDVALRVDNLGKQYRIGAKKGTYNRLSERLTSGLKAVFRYGRRRSTQDRPDTIWAIRHAAFEVKQGEVVGIIGRNGAGKSTLLKLLSRITAPTEGRILLQGRLGSLLEVGTGFHPELTGRENIYLNGTILGMRRNEIRRNFDAIVDFAEIEHFLDTPVKRYSSGMYVRLAFAVAAHLQPEILIVDEVLAVGDVAFQKKCLGKMGDIGREGRTVLLVSHNMSSIVHLCHRAILLEHGQITADGPPARVVEGYLAGARQAEGELVWPDAAQAPGNELVRLHAICVLQEGSPVPTADVDIAREVLVRVSYRNFREGSLFHIGLSLEDQHGTLIFLSGNAPSISLTQDRWYGRPHPEGLFHTICRIPGNFLNEGRYAVTGIVADPTFKVLASPQQPLSFYAHDSGAMRKEYHGPWAGVIRPRLAWRTEFAETALRECKSA